MTTFLIGLVAGVALDRFGLPRAWALAKATWTKIVAAWNVPPSGKTE